VEPRLQLRIQQRGWDRAVEHYQRFWREQLRPAHEAVLAAAALRPGERVIDIACGTGMVTLPAARAVGPRGRVLATDISQRMVDDTARRAAEWTLANVDTERRDAEDLGPHGGFDVALCSLGLMYVPQPAAALAEIARVVRPGGRFVAAVWGERRNCGWAEIFPIVDARVSSDVCPLFFGLGAPSALAELARRTGFVALNEHRIGTELVYEDADAAIGAAFLGGPVALAHSRFDAPTRESAYAEYLESIEPFRHGRAYHVPGEFVVVAGAVPAADDPPNTSNTSNTCNTSTTNTDNNITSHQPLKEPTP
jgi:ubiquinone/menaquinone biosynthesis C-methylase UbiE